MDDREELIEWLWKLADGAESPPTKRELRDHPDAPPTYYYRKNFASLIAAFRAAGFDEDTFSDRIRGKYSDEEVLEMLQEFGEELGHPPSSYEVQKNDALPAQNTFTNRFGDWQSVLDAAGFDELDSQNHFQNRDPQSTSPTDEFPQTVSPDTIARTPAIVGAELTVIRDGDEQTLSSGRISVGGTLVSIDGFELAVTDRGRKAWIVRLTRRSDECLIWLDDFIQFCDKTGVDLD